MRHFVDKYNRRLNKRIEGMTDDALALLQAYAWPGNIRELENLIERDPPLRRRAAHRRGRSASMLGPPAAAPRPGPAPRRPARCRRPPGETGLKDIVRQRAAELEKDLITRALEETGGNVTRAAKLLADQPEVAADEDEGVLASRRRRRVSVEADGQRCQ